MPVSRRTLIAGLGGAVVLGAGASLLLPGAADAALPKVTVWKDPGCGCCGAWVEHMQAAGFPVEVHLEPAMNGVKARLGVSPDLASCHTATVEGYVLEGHVPADDVKRLLKQRPQAKGLAVPGMPQGSPGMETGQNDPYEVVLFGGAGGPAVFSRYNQI